MLSLWSYRAFAAVCISLLWLGPLSPPALAQIRELERDLPLSKQIAKEKRIRLETAALEFQMYRPTLSGDTLRGPGDTPRISLDEIREISVYRTHTREGAGAGALVGLLSGIMLGSLAQAYATSEGGDFSGQAIGLVSISTLAGAALGALVGRSFSGWKVIYREPARPETPER